MANYKITGIGSLPDMNKEEAIHHSLQYDLPYLPQLLNIDGDMIIQASNMSYKLLSDWVRSLQESSSKEIKVQLVGPTSSKLSINTLKRNIDYLKERLQNFDVYFTFDEPLLSSNSDLKLLIDYAKKEFHKVGIHCCNKNIIASEVNEFNIDFISYDYLLNPKLHNFLDEKVEILLGVISPVKSSEKLTKFPQQIKNIKYITPTCGLAHADYTPKEILTLLKNYK